MTKLNEYINKMYPNQLNWFESEVEQPFNMGQINKTINNKRYLQGKHKILERPDQTYQGKNFETSKLVLNNALTIENFHSSLLCGKSVSLSGSADLVAEMNKVYRSGGYHKANFNIVQNLWRYGNAFEYQFINSGVIQTKVLPSEDCVPVYNHNGEYIGLIQTWSDVLTNVSVYIVYDIDAVKTYSNEGGTFTLINEQANLSGLPIHYKNTFDDMLGSSELDNIRPILDKVEELMSKYIDSVYTLSMNPIGVMSGQKINEPLNQDGTYVLSLEDGADFKYAQNIMDSQSIDLILKQLHLNLNIVSSVPSVIMGNSNASNVSEVSLELLYNLAYNKANQTKVWLDNFELRHKQIIKLLGLLGKSFEVDSYVDVVFNYSKPSDTKATIEVLSKQYQDGCLSPESYIELSPLTQDKDIELSRLGEIEGVKVSNTNV